MTMNRKTKAILVVLGVLLTVLLLYRAFGRILPGLIPVLKSGNEKEIEVYLSKAGRWDGYLCVYLLQFLQVVTVVFPGWPIQVAAGIIYGGLRAFLITFLAYWSANMAVFYVIRQMKNAVVPSERLSAPRSKGLKKAKQIRENTFIARIKNTHPMLAVAMGVLMPGMPNGFIPYVAAGTSMGMKQFALAVAAGCAFPIFMTCLAGHFIITGDYLISIVMIACPIVLVAVLYWNQYRIIRYLERNKTDDRES